MESPASETSESDLEEEQHDTEVLSGTFSQLAITTESSPYNPLETPDAIRIIHLQPGTGADRIVCELSTVQLSNAPPYEAISYVWGNPNITEPVECDDSEIDVTVNLAAALRRVRLRDSPRLIWADALCINQKNIYECNHQVRNMFDIYKNAERVLVWLGTDPGDHADGAFALVRNIYQRIKQLHAAKGGPFVAGKQHALSEREVDELHTGLGDSWASLRIVFLNDYFKRMWIQQELGIARKATLMCGDNEVDWKMVYYTSRFLNMEGKQIRKRYRCDPENARRLYRWFDDRLWERNKFSLEQICDIMIQSKCSKPHDRVYALIRHPLFRSIGPFEVDYHKHQCDVYMDLVLKWITKRKSLDFIGQFRHSRRLFYKQTEEQHWPTWVPNFAGYDDVHGVVTRWVGTFKASRSFPPDVNVDQNARVLQLKGFAIDSVSKRSQRLKEKQFILSAPRKSYRIFLPDSPNPPEGHKTILKLWKQIIDWDLSARYPNARKKFEAFLLTLVQANLEEELEQLREGMAYWQRAAMEDEDLAPQFHAYEEALKTTQTYSVHAPWEYFMSSAGLASRRSRVFCTRNGYLGLGSDIVRNGDIVAILYGGKTPFILRPKDDYYFLVGTCYIHGIMYGEAVDEFEWAGCLTEEFEIH